MTTSYRDLLAQREELEKQIAEARRVELSGAVAKARELVAEFDLTVEDIFGGRRASKTAGTKVAPKYRDPVSGATWTGRGKAPRWIQDAVDREAFAI